MLKAGGIVYEKRKQAAFHVWHALGKKNERTRNPQIQIHFQHITHSQASKNNKKKIHTKQSQFTQRKNNVKNTKGPIAKRLLASE